MTDRRNSTAWLSRTGTAWIAALTAIALLLTTAASGAEGADPAKPAVNKPAKKKRAEILYEARVVPSEGTIHMTIDLSEVPGQFEWFRFRIDPDRHTAFSGDGVVTEVDGAVEWVPPANGGRLDYTFKIDHLRDSRTYDARGARTWAIFRGDDLVPPARSRFVDGTRTRAQIQFIMPESWSVASPHPLIRGNAYRVEGGERAFTRPTGWYALGDLGVVREEVGETKVAIAGPVRHGLHRLDILAMLRLTLPEMNRIRGEPMERLLVVGAGDPMWRGGLSGPESIFIHAERPLITADATSPLLHELVHTSMSAKADDESDWIVEGMAEYYSMELLRRIGALSPARIERELDEIRDAKGRKKSEGHGGRTSTQQGLLFMVELDRAIRERSGNQASLDDVFGALALSDAPVNFAILEAAVASSTGLDPVTVMPETPSIKAPKSK